MTSIPALPPAPFVLPNAAVAENNPRAMTTDPDFESQLKAQSKPPQSSPRSGKRAVTIGVGRGSAAPVGRGSDASDAGRAEDYVQWFGRP
jgi:hypothetical protein